MLIKIDITEQELKSIWKVEKMVDSKQPAFTVYLEAIREKNLAADVGSIFKKIVEAVQ